MIYVNDVKKIVDRLKEISGSDNVVCNDKTSLLVQGFYPCIIGAGFMVPLSVYSALIDAGVAKEICTHKAVVHLPELTGFEIVIEAGLRMVSVEVDGVKVTPVDHIRSRALVIAGDIKNKGWSTAKVMLSMIDSVQAERKAALERDLERKLALEKKQLKSWLPDSLTPEQRSYEDRCKSADWYYGYSDDLSVYKAGKAVCEELEQIAASNGGAYRAIYDYYSKR